jgi:formate transporter
VPSHGHAPPANQPALSQLTHQLFASQGKASLRQLAKSWAWSYAGNLLGTAAFVAAIAASGVVASASAPQAAAVAKTSMAFGTAFIRGMLCNLFVVLAIWQATAATSLPGKFLGAWLPVSAFVAVGFEHSVANMFFIPMGIAREPRPLMFGGGAWARQWDG